MIPFTNRKAYISKLLSYKDKDLIKVISGLRRSGKSTLLELFRKQLLDLNIESAQIHEYNFELPENYLNKKWSDLYFEIKEKLQTKKNYIFLKISFI
jgi:predicted AAA+ superfamily ATPase